MQTLEELKKFLEKERKECFEEEEEGVLTAEGKGMALMIDSIYQHMDWEPIKLVKRKLCKLTKEENEFWEETYNYYASKGYSEQEVNKLTIEATKRKFPRLRSCDKLI